MRMKHASIASIHAYNWALYEDVAELLIQFIIGTVLWATKMCIKQQLQLEIYTYKYAQITVFILSLW